MSASVETRGSRVWDPPLAKALDEAMWQAWVEKGRARDRRHSAARANTVKMGFDCRAVGRSGIVVRDLTPYEGVARFLVAAGAVVAMFQALHLRHYAFAAVFGALALLYNPLTTVLSFSGDWHRALLLMSAVPQVASLAWRYVSLADNVPAWSDRTESGSGGIPSCSE